MPQSPEYDYKLFNLNKMDEKQKERIIKFLKTKDTFHSTILFEDKIYTFGKICDKCNFKYHHLVEKCNKVNCERKLKWIIK